MTVNKLQLLTDHQQKSLTDESMKISYESQIKKNCIFSVEAMNMLKGWNIMPLQKI